MKMRSLRYLALAFFLAVCLLLTGCRYGTNRTSDFMDIFQAGGGVTWENPESGVLPPALGLYLQATDFLNLGAIYFNGVLAELDGRGAFAGPEVRTRYGILFFQGARVDQDYNQGAENYFKKSSTPWAERMGSSDMRWLNTPAKQLCYGPSHRDAYEGWPLMHRGWQYWENFAVELALCEPFITHFGFHLRLGFDPSEISDFILGIFTLDFKEDDLTRDEFAHKRGK